MSGATSPLPLHPAHSVKSSKRGASLAYLSWYSTRDTYGGMGIRFLKGLEVCLFSTELRSNSQPFEWIPAGISKGIKQPEGAGLRSWYSDSLRAGRSGDRIPEVMRFSTPFQNGPGAYPASYTMGTGSFPGVKRPGYGVDHPPHLAPRLKKEQSYTSTPPLGLRGLFQGEVYLYLYKVAGGKHEHSPQSTVMVKRMERYLHFPNVSLMYDSYNLAFRRLWTGIYRYKYGLSPFCSSGLIRNE